MSIVPILLPTYSQHIGYIFPTLSIIWCQYIPNRFPTYSPHPRQISCQVSNRYQAVRQIAKGTWSQAQPFLLSAWCFKLFQGYGKRTDITKSSKIHENHGILSLRIGDSWWFNSCFNGRYSPGFTLRFHAAPWDARARSCQRDPKPRFPPEVAGDAMNLWRSKSWGNQLLYFIYTRCKPIYVLYLLLVYLKINYGCEIVLGIFFWAGLGIFFGFLGWYHLPSVCNGLELEFVILHGICHIWACSPSILHGIYYMWACSPSILYGICHILACSPSILHGISYMWA